MALNAGTALERPVLRLRRDANFSFKLQAIAALATIRATAKASSVPVIILLVIAALGPESWARNSVGSSTTSLVISASHCFSVWLGRGRSESGEPS